MAHALHESFLLGGKQRPSAPSVVFPRIELLSPRFGPEFKFTREVIHMTMDSSLRSPLCRVAVVSAFVAFAGAAHYAGAQSTYQIGKEKAGEEKANVKPDVVVRSTPQNVVFGGLPIGLSPVAIVQSGQVVRIDSLTQQGATSNSIDPVTYYGVFGVKPDEVLQDMIDFWTTRSTRPSYGGGHILTGPVYIAGAEPGDMLEIQIIRYDLRVPYGINSTSPTSGVFATTYPGARAEDLPLDIPAAPAGAIGGLYPDVRQQFYRTATVKGKDVALFSDAIQVPLQPFAGTIGVAPATGVFVGSTPTSPPPTSGVQPSTEPGPFGGNMDNRDLTTGATLYVPVFQPGAQFFVGDTHSVQGDGEVSGTAIEHSLTGLFRFVLHKGKHINWPRAENDDYYIIMGIDHDLNRAMKIATQEVINFLVEEKGLTVAKAFSLASIGVNFVVSEVVDRTQVVSGKIPKSLFIKTPPGKQ